MTGGARQEPRARPLLLAAALIALASAPALAGEASWVDAWMAAPGATGSWFGLRDTLAQRGITPTVTYVTDLAGNPVGGQRRGVSYSAQLNAEVSVDLGRLAGLRGLTFDISANWASGTDLSTDDIGNFFVVTQAFAGDRVRLYTLYFDQSLLDGRLDIKAGRIAPGDDFLSWPAYTFFMNIALNPAVYAAQVNVPGFTAAPISTWGVRVRGRPADAISASAGLYYSDPARDLVNTAGTDFGFSGSGTGALAVVELGYLHNQSEGDAGSPGNYRFGAYVDSNRFPTFADPATTRRGNWGLYAMVDQVIYRPGPPGSGRGLALFGAFVAAPAQSINTMPYFATVGAVYRGLVPAREKDALGAVAYYGTFSRDLPGLHSETVLELTYTLALSPWLTVQPDIQYVITPGGRSSVKNALVIGAQITVTF